MRNYLTIIACLTLAQLAACAGAGQNLRQEALSFTLRLSKPGAEAAQAMAEALSARLESEGISGGEVRLLGADRLQVLMPANPNLDSQLLAERLLRPSSLVFYRVDENAEFFDTVRGQLPADGAVVLACETSPGVNGHQENSRYLMANSRRRLDKFLVQLEPPEGRRLAVLNGEWGALAYLLEDPPALEVPAVNHVAVVPEPDGRPSVLIAMRPEQREAFTRLTSGLVGRRLAVVVDGEIRSLPLVAVPIDTGLALIGSSPLVPPAVAERQARALSASLRAWQLAGGLTLEQ